MFAYRKMATTKRLINIRTVCHRKTGLLTAFSDDLPGLLVTARTEDEMEEKLPAAVREMVEANGGQVVGDVIVTRDEEHMPESFGPPAFIANAVLQAA